MKDMRRFMQVARIAAAVLFMALFGLAFSGACSLVAPLLRIQCGPALMKCLAAFSEGALAVALIIALATFLFGRFYCSILCPLGVFQEILALLSRRKGRTAPNYARTRYGIAGVVFGLLFCGWSTGFLLLDPYSICGRAVASFTLGGLLPIVAVAVLAILKGRLYCTAVCPVGTLLGLLAKHGVVRMTIKGSCVKCGRCVRECHAGCIDIKNGLIDNERCIRCMNCLPVCPKASISLVVKTVPWNAPFNASRRAFLAKAGIFAAGVAAGAVLAKTGLEKLKTFARQMRILPPGAGSPERFVSKCTSCQLCTANCPAKIIVPAPGGTGPVSLDLRRGSCQFDCHECSQVCPTGAIRNITLAEKQRTKIAEALFNPENCLVYQNDEECGHCAAVCPTHAIALRKNMFPMPVKTDICIGCGACQEICPAPEKAMTVHAIEQQSEITHPNTHDATIVHGPTP